MSARRTPIIIGTGIAGLYTALRAHELGLDPVLITKSALRESNTLYAQGGIAAAIGRGDSPVRHFRDTVKAGAGLVERKAARVFSREAPERIADLVRFGVPFDTVEGEIALGKEAAHSLPRVLHSGGDATGRNIENALQTRVLAQGITVREGTALRRILSENGRMRGLVVSTRKGEEFLEAETLVLATGGGGRLYRESSNPSVATGEGVAIALLGGATVRDMEFVQFHPTVFTKAGAPRFLITEAIRGEGAVLRNREGRRFMPSYHRQAELAPRDVVARSIIREMDRLGDSTVFLDATALPGERLRARFPTVYSFLEAHGFHLERDLIPVTPVAHFMGGGVATTIDGETSVRGLYAVGEVSSTGLHGANRLASNSLMEGVVFGERTARALAELRPWGRAMGERPSIHATWPGDGASEATGPLLTRETLGELLWQKVGIIRERAGLREAVHRLSGDLAQRMERLHKDQVPSPEDYQVLTGFLMAAGALTRKESRGGHFRTDFPKPRESWRVHVTFRFPLGHPAP